jgi:indolepyruvate ferredoxin oxidoreductase
VVSAGAKTQTLLDPSRAFAVVNTHETTTSAFTLNRDYHLPAVRLRKGLYDRLGSRLMALDASALSTAFMGDSIYANMILLGAAWQVGRLPLSLEALTQAITLNGAAVERNQMAFTYGRWAAFAPEGVADMLAQDVPAQLDAESARMAHLKAYQGRRLLKRYERLMAIAPDAEFRDAMAQSFHKLLTYKDEYEVARLLRSTQAQAEAAFEGDVTLSYHLAPPLLSKPGPNGRPMKRVFGAWIAKAFPLLAAAKVFRGTPLDLFGYTHERRQERALITQYEQDMKLLLADLTSQNRAIGLDIARLPLEIRGFGPVKAQAMTAAASKRTTLLRAFEAPAVPLPTAAE